MSKIVTLLIFALAVLSQALTMDSVTVDSVWNSDSSWSDAQGAHQRISRDCIVGFKPMEQGLVRCRVSLSLDSGRTWDRISDSVVILDSLMTAQVPCGYKSMMKIRILGGDRENVVIRITGRLWSFGIGSDAGSIVNNVWTPGRDADGSVTAASWATVPAGEWVQVAGSNPNAVDAEIKAALPGWNDANWTQLFSGTWSGCAYDWWSGERMWFFGGGHQTSYNNGLYRFDAFRMKWAVQCLPSGPDATSGFDPGTQIDPVIVQATIDKYNAGQLGYINDIYSDQYRDGKPWSRHTYGWMAYAQNQNRIIMAGRGFWSFNLSDGKWDYHRVINDTIEGTGQIISACGPTSASDPKHLGIEDGIAIWDEKTGEYFADQNGSNGYPSSVGFNWITKSWETWSGHMTDGEECDTRYGRNCVKIKQPRGGGSWGIQGANYSVYNLDSRTVVASGQVQPVGFEMTDFFGPTSSRTFDGPSLTYIPSINRYWAWFATDAPVFNSRTLFEIDPTTTPWTMTKKITTGNVPVATGIIGRKMFYMSAINAVVFYNDGVSMMYVYKF